MWLKFGSLKTSILEVNGSNMHTVQTFQDFQITSQLFWMVLVLISHMVPCSKGDRCILWKQC